MPRRKDDPKDLARLAARNVCSVVCTFAVFRQYFSIRLLSRQTSETDDMRRFVQFWLPGLVLGGLLGLYLGWFQFPRESFRGGMTELAQSFRDDYAVMIAAGYAADGDLPGALDRLSRLRVDDVARYVQRLTDSVIVSSSRDIRDIRLLVALARGLGRLTPAMEPFLDLSGGGR